MQIVIPMSGFGERFRRAGYTLPKPLIEVDDKPIIAHVVDLFPGESEFHFICNEEHLAAGAYGLEATLRKIAPGAQITAVAPHKRGPVHAVLEGQPRIDSDRPVIVNYCDFACYWDFADFKAFVADTACDGAIPCYRGFHPHSLRGGRYAYVQERGLWATGIQEKQPFTADPMNEFASSGTYYFRSGALMCEAFAELVRRQLSVNGEFYVSMAYKPLLDRGSQIAVYELQHFMQWGTPEDLQDYRDRSESFRALTSSYRPAKHKGATLVPAAGLGRRYAQEGYADPKPLIPVSGAPMVVQALRDLPLADRRRIILRGDLPRLETIKNVIHKERPKVECLVLQSATDGQARTCFLATGDLDPDAPLTIGACDNGILYRAEQFDALMDRRDVDVIVWGVRGYGPAMCRPEHYGWIEATQAGVVRSVSVKKPLQDPLHDPIIIGTFTFKKASQFVRAAERLFARNVPVGGEHYVDSLINESIALGQRCHLFEVDHYLGWGTPEELKIFEYWQRCFHKWPSHPYTLERDAHVHATARESLLRRFQPLKPARPMPRSSTAPSAQGHAGQGGHPAVAMDE